MGTTQHSSGALKRPLTETLAVMTSISPNQIIDEIVSKLPGVVPKSSWGETSLFYNPGNVLPNGVYFCTIKDHDGENDTASKLNRDNVFRLAIDVPPVF